MTETDEQIRQRVLAECRAERVAEVVARGGTPEEIAAADEVDSMDFLAAAWAVAGANMSRGAR